MREASSAGKPGGSPRGEASSALIAVGLVISGIGPSPPELDPAVAECTPHLGGRQPKQGVDAAEVIPSMVSGLLSRLTAAIGVGWIEADGASPVGVSVVNYLSAPLLGDNPLRGRSLFP